MNARPPFLEERWDQTPVEGQEYIRVLEARVASLEATVQDLTERLQQPLRHSSRPPSSDPPPATEQRQRREPRGRPPGEFGPRVQAITALGTGASHLSKRTTQSVMADLLGLPRSLGTIANLEQATRQALVEPVAEARASGQEQPAASLDETGGREGQHRAWLGAAVTAGVTVFAVRLSRGAKVARALVGEPFQGLLGTDRWTASTWSPSWLWQVCWAPLLRDFEAMIERGGRSAELGEALRAQARQMFHVWHRVRDGTRKRSNFRVSMSPLRRAVARLLAAGQTWGVPKTEGVCREILKRREALWTFVQVEGVEPTNNAAERAIRPGVLWRKGSFGTQSSQGSHFVEAMMTVVVTLKTAAQRPRLCHSRLRSGSAWEVRPFVDPNPR